MYNDQKITEVSESEVFQQNGESTATPYFLVFLREDLTEQLVDAVVRGFRDESSDYEGESHSTNIKSESSENLLQPDSTSMHTSENSWVSISAPDDRAESWPVNETSLGAGNAQ